MINIVHFRMTRKGSGYVTRKGQMKFVSLNLVKNLCFDLRDLHAIVLKIMNGEILGKIDQHPKVFKSNWFTVGLYIYIYIPADLLYQLKVISIYSSKLISN